MGGIEFFCLGTDGSLGDEDPEEGTDSFHLSLLGDRGFATSNLVGPGGGTSFCFPLFWNARVSIIKALPCSFKPGNGSKRCDRKNGFLEEGVA